ncbi:MAG: NAD(P)-dependent oxidoreductase [Oliverpabstia sp.]
MKIAIVGVNGNLGTRVKKQALDRGFEVKGFIHNGNASDERVEIIKKSLFDMTKEDIADCNVMISAYGSGFQADPTLNRQAFLKYIELNAGTKRHLIAIGGAGSLFTDRTHTIYCYETPEHPDFLREISRNIKLGIDELKKRNDVNWTVVCPSSFFDLQGSFTGEYEIGTEGHLLFNKKGESRVTYDDLAKAMLDIAENNTYNQKQITVLTK